MDPDIQKTKYKKTKNLLSKTGEDWESLKLIWFSERKNDQKLFLVQF
jgi:hypothetical protein